MLSAKELKQTLVPFSENPVLSLYLHVDNSREENQAPTPAWRIELKNALRHIEEDLKTEAEKERWEVIRNQVDAFFNGYSPRSKSLVLFADGDTLKTEELPVTVESSGQYGEPLLTPMLWVMDEYERYLIVQVDQEQARFISGYLGSAYHEDAMRLELDDYDFGERTLMPPSNADASGAGVMQGQHREQFEDMIDEHRQRFYRAAADHTDTLLKTLDTNRLILSGDNEAAHALKDQLSPQAQAAVVAVVPAPLRLSEAEVLETVLEEATAYEREHEMTLVEEIINAAKAGGSGALGHDAVLKALREQRAELLVLPYDNRSDADLTLGFDPTEIQHIAYQQNTAIELVHGEPAQRLLEEGGVGAKLYYAMPTSDNA